MNISDRQLFIIHWTCFMIALILILLTIARIIAITLFEPNLDEISLKMIDGSALRVILYFLILPLYTLTYRVTKHAWIFFPWQHNHRKK
jgi:hypothetical protein